MKYLKRPGEIAANRWMTIVLLVTYFTMLPFDALATSITYGGRLTEPDGRPTAGPVDLEVAFYKDQEDGAPLVSGSFFYSKVPLINGLFSIELSMSDEDFHQVFAGDSSDTWIEVKDASNSRVYPRQAFSPVPYALKTPVDDQSISYNSQGKLQVKTTTIRAGDDSGQITLRAASGANSTYTWPGVPVNGQFLTVDGDGAMRWSALPGGGDMATSTYDMDTNSRVDEADNASQLGGQSPSYYLDMDEMQAGSNNKLFTATEQSKLSSVESGADVTDVTNVAATGALMDSDFTFDGILVRNAAGSYSTLANDSASWNTAYNWGNHSTAGYLTSIGADTIDALALASTTVTPGSYSLADLSVDSDGRITSVNNGSVDLGSEVSGVLPVVRGGTGAASASSARTALGAAAAGINFDITDLQGLNEDVISGDAIQAGTISNFASTGIDDNSSTLALSINNAGNIAIGGGSANAKLHVNGQIVSRQINIGSGGVIDFLAGNTQTLDNVGGPTISLTGLINGGKYTVIVRDPVSRTYNFSGCSNSYFQPAKGPTATGTRTVYAITYVDNSGSSECYIDWSTGYQ